MKINTGLFSEMSNPAQRALANAGIKTIEQLAKKTEKEVLTLHGIGPSSLPILKKLLKSKKLSFKKII
jgi:DNA-directed RNA polymerase alpha subunit